MLKEGGKYDPHDYSYDYPPPYIPRRYTFEIDERVDAQGNVVRPLDQNQAREVVRTLAQRHFEAVAVCLLWSIANGSHEKEIAKLIEQELPGIPYTLSHELVPIVREYRRASTTAIDASLKPLMQRHLREMEADLRAAGFSGAANALSTWGDIRDFKHYLPRLLELLISEELDGFYGDMFARVLGGRWRSWPQDEQDAFVAVVDAWWRFTLHHYPRDVDVLEVLKIIVGEFGLDLRTYLAAWEGSAGDEAAALHMAWLVWWFQYELDLDTDWHRSLESWITSPASARIIESALASTSSTEVLEELRDGLRWL